MPELSRSQLLVYGAIAIAVLLIGARWIRSGGGGPSSGGPQVSFAADSSHERGGTRDWWFMWPGRCGDRACTGCRRGRG